MSKLLITPGPTNVPEEIREIMGMDLIHHRAEDFHNMIIRMGDSLKKIFETKHRVMTLTASGTGGMEAAVVNLFSTGDKVVVINVGNFGRRFVEICETYHLEVIELEYEWGTTYDLDQVKQVLAEEDDVKGLFVQYSETSTGVLNNLKELGKLTAGTETLLVADCISGMVVNEFKFDEWGIDCAIAGSQKGFLLPPGLAFIALSKRAEKAMYNSNLPKYYFDLKKAIRFLREKHETPFTPAIPIMIAAEKACNMLLEQGLEEIQAYHTDLRMYVEKRVKELGFKLFVKNPDARGNTLVTVTREDDVDLNKLKNDIDAKYDITLAGGQGDYAGKILRIGCLGKLTKADFDKLFSHMEEFLAEYK